MIGILILPLFLRFVIELLRNAKLLNITSPGSITQVSCGVQIRQVSHYNSRQSHWYYVVYRLDRFLIIILVNHTGIMWFTD